MPRVITYSYDDSVFHSVLGWWASAEAGATISSPCGRYIFGSRSGRAILNERGRLIPGGNIPDSGRTTWVNQGKQHFLIVPQPLTRDCYWLFVNATRHARDTALCYSRVDMSANNGRGQVSQKETPFTPHPTRLVAGTQHANRKDFWVVTREVTSHDYLAYHLSERGLDLIPVRSPGLYTPDTVGMMRFSPDGARLASPAYYTDSTGRTVITQCVARFDPATGRVRDEMIVEALAFTGVRAGSPISFSQNACFWGTEFSGNSRFLYTGFLFSGATRIDLFQFDLAAGTPNQIRNTKYHISLQTPMDVTFSSGLQLTPFGQIIVLPASSAAVYRQWLPVIRHPNEKGAACGFEQQAIAVPRQSVSASPNVINSMLLDTVAEIRHLGGCGEASDTVQLWLANPGCAQALRWEFGDPASGAANVAAEWFPRHAFSAPGTYRVTAATDDGRVFSRVVAVDAGNPAPAPDIFTPNADGLNDTFRPVAGVGSGEGYRFRVFNRWGAEVFATTDPLAAWTGAGLSGGVYFYHLSAHDCAGRPLTRRGPVTLIR